MTDLVCTECGAKATYADAQLHDRHRTCESRSGEHDWQKPVNPEIDVVSG